MKLATLRDGTRDGTLVVVSRDLARCRPVPEIARTLQAALDDWDRALPGLLSAYDAVNAGVGAPFRAEDCLSPLPRAYEWVDGSAFLHHVALVRKARGADMPPSMYTDPLVYQGGSGALLAPTEPIPFHDPAWGLDLEGEVAVVLGDVPLGTKADTALSNVRLLMLVNDVTLRGLVPNELAKGFGFFQSKPATAFSPVAVTPDELGEAWRDGRVHLPLHVDLNGAPLGRANAAAMHFSFAELIAHLAKTRAYVAGTILGSGTVSEDAPGAGVSCLAEARTLETLRDGAPKTPWLQPGDRVRIAMFDDQGQDLFGQIQQTVVSA